MAFRCKVCEIEITSTSQMELTDGRDGKVRHLSCPGPVASPPPPANPTVGEMCIPVKPSTCAVCGDRCIAMCPSCHTLVCQAYGWNGKTCGISHEGNCSGARDSRSPRKSGFGDGTVTVTRTPFEGQGIVIKKKNRKNGRHA